MTDTLFDLPLCDLPGYLSSAPDINRLYDNIQATVPGLTDEMLAMVVWNTIEDFYMTSTYRRELIYFRLDPGVLTLSFDPYDQYWRVSRFLGFSGVANIKFEPPGRIRDLTSPTPDSERNGEIYLSLKPRSLQTPLPYDVWTTYFDTLYNGACGRLYMQPAKPYSDMNAARVFISMYRKGVASARAEAQSGHMREGSSWSYPYFASGGNASGRGSGHFGGRR